MSTCDHICRECGQVMNCQHCKPYSLPADRARIAELEAMILRLVDDAHRMHMIGPGYRDHAQVMLYAEANKLIGK